MTNEGQMHAPHDRPPSRPRLRRALMAALPALMLLAFVPAPAVHAQTQQVAVLVNDEPITNFDVQQRMRLLTVSSRKPANEQLRREAIDQLIDEKLMMQEARRLDVTVPPERVQQTLNEIAARSNMNQQQFAQALSGVGINIRAFSRRIEAQILWPMVVQKRFAGRIHVSDEDINKALEKIEGPRESTRYDYMLQTIMVLVPRGASGAEVASRQAVAERIRRNFRGCAETRGQVTGLRDIVVTDLGERNSATLPPDTRKLLERVEPGQTTAPSRIDTGFELTAVCSRTTVKDDQTVRIETQVRLLNQEYENMARRHLRDLRLDANIEIR